MTQQTFTVEKQGDSLYSISTFGYTADAVPIQPHNELEFLIFHGVGGLSFDFSVGTLLPYTNGDRRRSRVSRVNNGGIDLSIFQPSDWGWTHPPTIDVGPGIPQPPGPGGGGGGGSPFDHEAITVKLFRPHENTPIRIWDFPQDENRGLHDLTFPVITTDNGVVVLPAHDLMQHYGWWRCRVIINSDNPAFIVFSSRSFLQAVQMHQVPLSYRWLNHAFKNVLSILAPQARIEGSYLSINMLDELSKTSNFPSVKFTQNIDGLDSSNRVELTSVSSKAKRGQDILDYIQALMDKIVADCGILNNQITDANKEIDRLEASGISVFDSRPASLKAEVVSLTERLGELNDRWERLKDKLERAKDVIEPDDLAIQITAGFFNPKVSFSKSVVSFDLTFDKSPVIFIALGSNAFSIPFSFVDLEYQLNGLNPIEDILFKIFSSTQYDLIHHINETIEQNIVDNFPSIVKYLQLALSKAAGQNTFVDSYHATGAGWVINCYEITVHPDPNNPFQPIDLSGIRVHPDTAHEVVRSGDVVPSPTSLPGTFPNGFHVTGGVALERLDKLKTLVVVMMENRSFDHMLGDLSRQYPHRTDQYTCFPANFTNAKAGNFANPIPVCKAKDAGFKDVLVTPISPEHGHEHVMMQIGNGTDAGKGTGDMNGFTVDIITRFDELGSNIEHPDETPRYESPQMVMTYYQKEQLPTYYYLAEQFKVLDHWFAAHPGPTWPNRIATHTGKLIELNNFSLTNDKRVGYFKEKTIFDTLSSCNIEWRFLESSLSIMRIFDRYRIDDKNVIPLHDEHYFPEDQNLRDDALNGLEYLLQQDTLPRVIFIEPRFSDEPPIKTSNDDLAPTNLGHGQDFINKICKKLLGSRHWKDLSMLVTYDEHGGFFDHVAPPGTPKSGISGIPKIHPDGPACLGVRVPGFLVSPYVSPASIAHTIFDHTSILKTILVHNRAKIPTSVFNAFSERVNQAEHLGAALDLDNPRNAPEIPTFYPDMPVPVNTDMFSFYSPNIKPQDTDFHEVLRTLFMPK